VAWSPDGTLLASGGSDELVRIWDVRAGTSRVLEGHQGWVSAVAWSPDGSRLASAGDDERIRLWDVSTGTCRAFEGSSDRVNLVAWSPDGNRLASGERPSVDGGTIRVWNVLAAPVQALFVWRYRKSGVALVPEYCALMGSEAESYSAFPRGPSLMVRLRG